MSDPLQPTVGAAASALAGTSAAAQEGGAAGAAAEVAAVGVEYATTAAVSSVASPVVGKAVGAVAGVAARSKVGRAVLAGIAGLVVIGMTASFLMIMTLVTSVAGAMTAFMGGGAEAAAQEYAERCYGNGITPKPIPDASTLNEEQRANFLAVMSVVEERGLSAADAIIATMTALTESSLINIDHGDMAGPDSRGLFQQRDPWGPYEVRMSPTGATGLFLDSLTSPELRIYKSIELVNGAPDSRYGFPPWLVAQSVQRSAFSDGSNYRKMYEKAAGEVATVLDAEQMATANVELWSAMNVGGVLPIIPAPGTIYCDDTPGPGGNYGGGPGAWGGHQNGRIPIEHLAPIPWTPTKFLRSDAAAQLTRLNSEFAMTFGYNIGVTDAYRTYEEQEALKIAKPGLAAKPGTSNHGWALALDLATGINNWGTPQRTWMITNAPRFGWISPGWAQPGKGREEPWHWEFQGTPESGQS